MTEIARNYLLLACLLALAMYLARGWYREYRAAAGQRKLPAPDPEDNYEALPDKLPDKEPKL